MLRDQQIVGFVATTDVERARPFYVDVLGLELVEVSPFALVVRSGPTMIRVTPVPNHVAAPQTVLGWDVDDLLAELTLLVERGVRPLRYDGLEQDDLGAWQAPSGALVAWFADPDGNVLSLTQF